MKKIEKSSLLATNIALVIVAVIIGLIVSCVAQFFMFSGKKVFELTHTESNYDFLNFSLFDQQFNFCWTAGIRILLSTKVKELVPQ